MLDRTLLTPMIYTVAPVGTDVSNLEAKASEKATSAATKGSRPVERFLVAGWRSQLQKAEKEYETCAGQKAFLASLEEITFGAWGHFNDSTLAVYAENESMARSYVAIAFDLMVRGLVVKKFTEKGKQDGDR